MYAHVCTYARVTYVHVPYNAIQHAEGLTHYDTSVWDPKSMVMFTMGEFDLEVRFCLVNCRRPSFRHLFCFRAQLPFVAQGFVFLFGVFFYCTLVK